MIELSLILPVILMTIFGLVRTGYAVTQFTWVQQSGYQIALIGAESLPEDQASRMEVLTNTLRQAHSDLWRGSTVPMLMEMNQSTSIERVRVKFSAKVNDPNSDSGNLGVAVAVEAPVLARSSKIPTNLAAFQNPTGKFYDCCGHPATVPPVSCLSCATDSQCTRVSCP